MKWSKPEEVLSEDNAFAVDLYSFGAKTYLSILNLNDDQFWSTEVWEKSSECITSLISGRADSLGLNLCDLTFLSDRGGQFAELSAYLKDYVKTASYHPEGNGKIGTRHKEVGMMCRLYEFEPPAVADLWKSGSYGVFKVERHPQRGELVLRYVQRKGSKSADTWEGPLIMQEQCGASLVRCLNLETKRALFVHINDLKVYQRRCTTDWKLNDKTKAELCTKLDVSWTDFDELFFE
jgi:hypothetical protein